MKIHEFQAKKLMGAYDIPVPEGGVASTLKEAKEIARRIGGLPLAIKAQIHAGGRGKGGGVKIARTFDEVSSHAGSIIGMNLVTPQTGPDGRKVRHILVEQGLDIASELYLSLTCDRESGSILIMASESGGMDIEQVARKTPEKIVKVLVDPVFGIRPFHLRRTAFGLNLDKDVIRPFSAMLERLYDLLVEKDASLVEINPLVITNDGRVIALDAKIDFDDNALFRHPDIAEFRDENEEDPLEVEASGYNLNYINMGGTVGNMVNGAGLAMAVMDTIKLAGAEPANFLDVGGGASAEMIENGFRIILSDPKVKALLINIFGGILRCDVLAEGVVTAARNIDIKVPVVVRMEGTNVEKGRKILAESGLEIITASDLKDAGEKVARLVA
ncbi:MAG: ADP-forming succinate--CoA ligase subunit beta [Deltaproteobacteria bacterium]|nr:ADP-forming succinate--CoA ligase subunit beta [Deltaproteobacteria bacterium]